MEMEAEEVEPVVLLEEERDPDKVLEERRKKREEIMAKFKANGGKAAVSAVVAEGKDPAGPGADSVNSAGTRTGMRTGLSASGELRSPLYCRADLTHQVRLPYLRLSVPDRRWDLHPPRSLELQHCPNQA